MSGPSLPDLARDFQRYLDDRREAHAGFKTLPRAFAPRVAILRGLQRELFEEGWARYGWPEEHGGLGGTVLHRALITDLLERNGYPPRLVFEHLDIIPPALVRFGSKAALEELFLATLRGDVLWCQGFSEPTAGSDLAALRTRAERDGNGYRLSGHKIWTSWAKYATHCFVLARTGTVEERHRGISAFAVDLDTPGLEVGVIEQANGTDEFAEVFFDGAFVPETHRIAEEGKGWSVAMHALAGERGSYAWLRQAELLPKLEHLASYEGAEEHAEVLGETYTRMLALRSRSRSVMEIIASGNEPGPESSVSKVLVIDAEQHFYSTARRVLSPDFDLGVCDDFGEWQDSYLYSRAASIYGGSREIQLNVIAKLMVSRGKSARGEAASDEAAAVRQSVVEAIRETTGRDDAAFSPGSADARGALDGLDWWAVGASPADDFGRAAFAAWFEAAGNALAISPAMAGVRGAALAEVAGIAPGELAVAVDGRRDAAGRLLAYGVDAATRAVAVIGKAGEASLYRGEGFAFAASEAFDPELLRRVEVAGEIDAERVEVDVEADARALALARLAAAHEILGASVALLDLAVAHANTREQFGQPIAQFQAIQHLLANSQVDVATLSELCDSALDEWSAGDAITLSRVAKAFAGRVGRDVTQRALQCFGAIGFTQEHPHPHYSRRIHTLDAVLGSHYALHCALGLDIVRSGAARRCIEVWRPGA